MTFHASDDLYNMDYCPTLSANTRCMKEGNVLFNDTLNTFDLRLYGVTYDKGPLR